MTWEREPVVNFDGGKRKIVMLCICTHTFCCIDIDVYRCRCRCRSRHRCRYAHRDLPKLCKSFSAKLPPQNMAVQADFLKMSGRSRYDNQTKKPLVTHQGLCKWFKKLILIDIRHMPFDPGLSCFFSWMQIHSPWKVFWGKKPPPERFLVENQVQLAIVRTGSRWVGLGGWGSREWPGEFAFTAGSPENTPIHPCRKKENHLPSRASFFKLYC